MEANLERKTLNFYKNLFNTSATHEETMEMIVPDALPDIQRVIDSDGVLILRSKEAEAGKATVGGIVNATVLYLPDGESEVIRLEVKMPFSTAYENGQIENDTRLTACVSLCSIECRVLNPRKILVRADVLTQISGYSPAKIELCSPTYEDRAIETLEQKENLKTISDVREKTFVISDEYALPSSRPILGEILKSNCRLTTDDMKTVGNKLIIKGTASVSVVYSSKADGDVSSMDFSSVFSQIIEIESAEEPEFALSLMPTGIFFDLADGPNGSMLLNMELHVVAQVVVMENKTIEYISDAYSIVHELSGTTENYSVDTVENSSMREIVRAVAETPVQARNVIGVSAFAGRVHKSDDENGCKFETPITITILYKSEDGRILSTSTKVMVEKPWEEICENVAYVSSSSCGDVAASVMPNGIDVRLTIDFLVTATRPQWINTISELSYDETKFKDLSMMPSVTVRRVSGGENLWSLAKRYNSTQNLIMDANGLEGEPEAGQLLLIPKRR